MRIAYLQLTMKVAMLENGKGGGRWEAVRNTHSKANSLFYQYKSYGNDWPNEINAIYNRCLSSNFETCP